jgi:hypothetical protein
MTAQKFRYSLGFLFSNLYFYYLLLIVLRQRSDSEVFGLWAEQIRPDATPWADCPQQDTAHARGATAIDRQPHEPPL